MSELTRIYYATDTFCIWCWGLGPALREFASNYADRAWVDVVPAGMLRGERVVAVREKPRAAESARRVAELTGVECGEPFFEALKEGSTVLDSQIAGELFVGFRRQLGERRGLDIAHALQRAWYAEGLDLHEDETVRTVAGWLDVDAGAVLAARGDEVTQPEALAEFDRCRELGVRGFPTLLVDTPDGRKQLGGPTSSAARLGQCFDTLMAGQEPEFDPRDDQE